ncbi:hypothetical protein [Geoalkalibacter subterraneus]|uniref:Uncharacterized protein n=1 Tax=Geoalkalibacter subterraneus TaxID=483547 RepID=A0A0B5FSG0_9BACT|nr:hypothetical protein [Geoalkalibacter subterraneus]AJF07075.1 hypothetical protein GSUB_11585 [Geoalkalibacter subterraneus]
MIDLLIRNAALPDGQSGIDVAIHGERIKEIGSAIDAKARRTIDAIRLRPQRLYVIRRGRLVAETAPAVPQLHLDNGTEKLDLSSTVYENSPV